ncbi:MAG: flippase [Deinococcota bacterium]
MFTHRLLGRRSLGRHTLLNIVGQAAPLIAAFFTIPLLIEGLGKERYGALTLAWLLTGYASIFDFGLGRALTQMVAQQLHHANSTDDNDNKDVAALVATALAATVGFSVLAGSVIYGLTPYLVTQVFRVPLALQPETQAALRLIAVFLPVVIMTTATRGVLEAYQQFLAVNLVSVPMGLLNYLAPLAILPFSNSLPVIVLGLIMVRTLGTFTYLGLCLRRLPWSQWRLVPSLVPALFRVGGWMSVSNILAPIMLSFDRFVLAGLTSLTAVTYYTTPYTVINKMRIVPMALMRALFPALARQAASAQTKVATRGLYRKSLLSLALVMVPAVSIVMLFAKPGLSWWLGADFADQSFRVAQLLALGVLVHSLGQPSFTLIQALGRPDITAKLHLAEIPLYVVYLPWLIQRFGITGAAAAWLIRVSLSTIVLTFLALWLLERPTSSTENPTKEADANVSVQSGTPTAR